MPALFAPAYIGGRTAAEHWDLTGQISNNVVVVTSRAIRTKQQKRHGIDFTLKHRKPEKSFGTKPVWQHHSKVPVSDVHWTVVDMLDDPAICSTTQPLAPASSRSRIASAHILYGPIAAQ